MTAKDFTLIAKTIASLNCRDDQDDWRDREYIARRFADNLAQTNPRFDRDRFIKAATTI